MNTRIGFGYDVHAFSEGRKLILGGVHIPFEKGLIGHSDADVLLHAITDALLGAVALGDIGTHFPDTDPAYENADSSKLLREAADMLEKHGYQLSNVDATVIAERPKLLPFIEEICASIAAILRCEINQVSVKATTNEKMGFVGRKEGIVAQSVVLVQKMED